MIDLDDFMHNMHQQLDLFKNMYVKSAAEDASGSWPDYMNEVDWLEQFLIFLDLN